MAAMPERRLLACSCAGTMRLDQERLTEVRGATSPEFFSRLCTTQLDRFRRAVAEGGPLLVCCTQEQPLFEEVAAEVGGAPAVTEARGSPAILPVITPATTPAITYVNIRERAGWSEEGDRAGAKMTALIAEAAVVVEPTPALTLKSDGVALIYGYDEMALEAAQRLADRLNVSCLLKGTPDILPADVNTAPVFCGAVRSARGHLGAFTLTITGFAAADPSSRRRLTFGETRDGVAFHCDVIVDLSGDPPLFPAAARRDGYFRAEPSDAVQVQRVLLDAANMVGAFEKPRYIRLDPALCAYARNQIVGCNACLAVCPTGAIVPNGDSVRIDPFICAGHGACASVCPTGAIRFDMPGGNGLSERLRVLLGTFRRSGGEMPVLLVHDSRHGDRMIGLIARTGRGLPAHVLPFAVHEVLQVGLDFLFTALAYGAAQVHILVPREHRDALGALRAHEALVTAIMNGLGYSGARVVIETADDPAVVEAGLYEPPPAGLVDPAGYMVPGDPRGALMLALGRLHAAAPRPAAILDLPDGAPFGRVVLDQERCTLCLACVGACPTRALGDNADKPQLTFTEFNCVQCGLCRATCPENAIRLAPRLNFAEDAKMRLVLKEEEPYACVSCGKMFGARTSIERLIERLAGHPMFPTPARLEILKMCEDCRVAAQFDDPDAPFALGPRRRPVTTDDYLRARERAASADPADPEGQ